MNVVINSTEQKQGKEQLNELFNIIKRSEEDLRRRIPGLKDISVKLSKISGGVASNIYGVVVNHTLSTDESTLDITLKYRTDPTTEQLTTSMTKGLKMIKEIYD